MKLDRFNVYFKIKEIIPELKKSGKLEISLGPLKKVNLRYYGLFYFKTEDKDFEYKGEFDTEFALIKALNLIIQWNQGFKLEGKDLQWLKRMRKQLPKEVVVKSKDEPTYEEKLEWTKNAIRNFDWNYSWADDFRIYSKYHNIKTEILDFISNEAKGEDKVDLEYMWKTLNPNIMKIVKVKDGFSKSGKSAMVFHSTRSQDLSDIFLKKEFNPGRGGGAMLGKGFYANLHLFQAQKLNYGPLIFKAIVYNIDRFFIYDRESYEKIYGPDANYLETQWKKFNGLGDVKYIGIVEGPQKHIYVWDKIKKLPGRPIGLIYRGNFDGLSMVCWYPHKNVNPLGVSLDKGETWIDPDLSAIKQNFESKHQSLVSTQVHEAVRTDKRAEDLKAKYEGKSDDQKIRAIKSHLSKITNEQKYDIRLKGLRQAFSELDWESGELLDLWNTRIDDSSAELKQKLLNYGVDPTGMSTAQMRQKLGELMFAEEFPGEEMPEQIDPMLAKDVSKLSQAELDKTYTSAAWTIQEKINGMRSILAIYPNGKIQMTSRTRSVRNYLFTPHHENVLGFKNIKSPFEGATILDGELMPPTSQIDTGSTVTTSPLQAVVALVHMNTLQSLEIQSKVGSLKYYAFDILKYNGEDVQNLPYSEREELLNSAVKILKDENKDIPLDVVPSIKDYSSAYQVYSEFIDRGAEGIMLKKKKGTYRQGYRSGDLLKVKGTVTVDGFITGAVKSTEGKGFENLIGGFIISAFVDGVEQEIAAVSNITDQLRQDATVVIDGEITLNPDYLYKTVELVGQEWTKNGRLVHARILEWRQDKDFKDCKLTSDEIKEKQW